MKTTLTTTLLIFAISLCAVCADATVYLGGSTYTVKQNVGAINIPIHVTQATPPVSAYVMWNLNDGTATSGRNYGGSPWGLHIFNPGDPTTTYLSIPIYFTADVTNATFSISLQEYLGSSLGSPASATITILGVSPMYPIIQADIARTLSKIKKAKRITNPQIKRKKIRTLRIKLGKLQKALSAAI